MASAPVVHLELHTSDRSRARGLYAELCGWPGEQIDAGRASYLALELGTIGGGIVECATERRRLGAVRRGPPHRRDRPTGPAASAPAVLLEPRECPNGWRSVVSTVQGGEIAFWQPKRGRGR